MNSHCLLSIDDFDKCKYEKLAEKIYVGKNIVLSDYIYRYIKLEYLIDLLETGNLYISNRKAFADQREVGKKLNKKNNFQLTPYPMEESDKFFYAEQARKIQESRNVCISCWTYDKLLINDSGESIENYLMWKSYSNNNLIVRIKTRIEDLLFSMYDVKSVVVANDVYYKKESIDYSVNDSIFSKTKYYRYEDEFRLCVLSTNSNICLPLNVERMLYEVTLSPFISKQYYEFIKDFMEKKYNFLVGKISKSEILEF